MINKRKYKNKKRVAILLSTYNGSRYLSQLINSVLEQTYTDYSIFIRDDKSKDETPIILSEFANENDNIYLIESDSNLGSKRSFFRLLECVDSELYMFCDQDDVWLPDKIEKMVSEYNNVYESNKCVPIVIHSDLMLVDKDLKIISDSYWDYCRIPVDMPHNYHLFCHFGDVTGCAMLFNSKSRECILPFLSTELPSYIYHDYLVALLSVKNNGIIVPVHQSLIKFRRHGENETNPLANDRSILSQVNEICPYLKEQRERCRFYNTFVRQPFIVFLFYKFKTKFLQIIWRKKQGL